MRGTRHSALSAAELAQRLRDAFDRLSPELRRAARWVIDHPADTGLLSMRQQAERAGVSAPTMVRLARALGLPDYASLRRPFQAAMAGHAAGYGRRASALQSVPGGARVDRLARELASAQVDNVQSLATLNAGTELEAAIATIAGARRVGFLGVRASFGIAYQFRYAYHLIARNGVLFDGIGGTLQDQVDALTRSDVLVAISQEPYSMPTVRAVDAAGARGVGIVALTDSALSPLARNAAHTLLFRTGSVSFFGSMVGPLALVELLVARLAARGGKAVLARLGEVEKRLTQQNAYWNPAGSPAP
ncbi:MAG TPA: MurR/RpiR family transcriptional regulator [Casimicrobiaceae bacterium]|jgi:DNA-binding MurR/RpiR family transcriptional regulator